MRKKEAKSILKHIKKDSKEFKSQLKEDKQLAKQIRQAVWRRRVRNVRWRNP